MWYAEDAVNTCVGIRMCAYMCAYLCMYVCMVYVFVYLYAWCLLVFQKVFVFVCMDRYILVYQ